VFTGEKPTNANKALNLKQQQAILGPAVVISRAGECKERRRKYSGWVPGPAGRAASVSRHDDGRRPGGL